MITDFCALRRCMGHAERFKVSCRRHIRRWTKAIVVDSAANEVLAAELQRTPAVLSALTPNSKILLRDKAHGARRLASRPFAAIEPIKDVVMRCAHGRGSPAQMIHWSPELRLEWRNLVMRHGMGHRVMNLRAAKHRYESFSKPLGRLSMLLNVMFLFLFKCLQRGKWARISAARWLK